jgi:hypothetical protein
VDLFHSSSRLCATCRAALLRGLTPNTAKTEPSKR